MSERILFHVQHLLGIGHALRSSRIAKALDRAGFAVTVAHGGVPVSGLDWGDARVSQLPAVSSGPGGFGDLVQADGRPASEVFKSERRDRLLDLFFAVRPDVVLIEAFPFARRVMRFELLPLLEAAHARTPRPLVVSSIRDILQEGRKPERSKETRRLVERHFDAVLVHGREDFAPLGMSFPEADGISEMLFYTGWVGPERRRAAPEERYDVIVSAGGGAVGAALFDAALKARAESAFSDDRWLMLAGPNLVEGQFRSLRTNLPESVRLERFRPDLPDLLRTAKVSISQAGYNTVADVLAAGCRAVFVPYAEGGETEQTRRAQLLSERRRAVAVREADLSPGSLSAAMAAALELPPPEPELRMAGASASAGIIRDLLGGRRRETQEAAGPSDGAVR